MKRATFARAPPGGFKTEINLIKNNIKKKGESQSLFTMYISLRFSAWVFSLFSPEMYKIIVWKGV